MAEEKSARSNKDNIDEKTELAENRTDWAQERTLLAKERTFSAWARTGISSMIAGVGIAEFLKEVEPLWIARILGILLILTGGTIFIIGFFSYKNALKELSEKDIRSKSIWVILIITLALIASAGLSFFIIILN
jgi:putative membrane protein